MSAGPDPKNLGPEYIITSRSRVVVQNFTEIGSFNLGGQIGEVLVFSHKQTNKQTNNKQVLVFSHKQTNKQTNNKQTNKQILSSRLQVTNMDRIEWINAYNTWFQVQMCLLGSRRWSITFRGPDPTKPKFMGRE